MYKRQEKISISQDSAKSKQITGENIYAEKQGPKIKSGSKKNDYPKDKTRKLTESKYIKKSQGSQRRFWIRDELQYEFAKEKFVIFIHEKIL